MIFAEEKGRTASEASAAAAPAPQASGVHEKRRSLKGKLSLIVALSIIPLVAMVLYLIISLVSYSNAYEEIVSNMTIANSYSLSFKEDMDESVYKLVVSGKSFDEVKDNPDENPYALIDDLRNDFTRLEVIKTDDKSRDWLSYLLRNIDTLEDRVDDIKANIDDGEGHYNENIDMVNNDIYILTELIQDNIQHYIYYQTESIEVLKDQLHQQVFIFIILFCIVLAALMAFLIPFVIRLIRNIMGPVSQVTTVTQKIAQGDFSARTKDIHTKDEIEVLADNVNTMAGSLDVMVTQIHDDETKMRHAELRLLQEQINPHFLYNTLDTIVWLIEGGKEEEAEDVVVSLSNFFRQVLSHGREYITISDETKHIRSYLEIQKVRYCDILNYEIDIDPELDNYEILKLSLQPIVENSLYHGIKYKRGVGTVKVTGRKDGERIVLKVSDDGVGMKNDELIRLREEIGRPCKDTETGFGLANVNERIRMNFGSEYGMTIDSVENEGTEVTLVIPAIPYSKDDKDGEGGQDEKEKQNI